MNEQTYFYEFLRPISKELAFLARELENSIFTSPRMMLTHARVFIENILLHVMKAEQVEAEMQMNLIDRIDMLDEKGYLTDEIRDSLHFVRKIGNQAAHDTRMFRYSEALLSWEAVYNIVRWYVEVYGPVDLNVPDYRDPAPPEKETYDMMELEERLKSLETLLKTNMEKSEKEIVEVSVGNEHNTKLPGYTTIRTIHYQGKKIEIPYFLRDAFLLPQRFAKSETFLIRLGAEQQARIISELPKNIEGLTKYVKRFNEKNEANFFHELKVFIEEEKTRRQIQLERPGELFFFYRANYIVVTEELAKVPLTAEEFAGIPSLIRQLQADQIETVGQLPKELVILAKYENVGVGTVEKLFEQLKNKQG